MEEIRAEKARRAEKAERERLLRDIDRIRERCQSLSGFIAEGWPYIDPAPFIPNWHIDAISEHLEAVSSGEIQRLIINMPPRHMKSLSLSVAWPAWVWSRGQILGMPNVGPQVQWLFLSYAQTLSVRDSVKCRRLIESPWYQAAFGHSFQLTSDQNTKIRFDNDRQGYRIASSVGGVATGEGGSIVAIDDPISAADILSETERTKVLTWWDETMQTRLNDPKTGAFVITMQRLHEKDLTGHILGRGGHDYTVLCLPARYEPDHPYVYGKDPRRHSGELLWPARMGEKEVTKLEASLGSYACTPIESPVLMADLTMKPIGAIKAGDEVVGFERRERLDDKAARMTLKPAKVLEVHKYTAPVVRMTLDSGRTIRCTPDHKWFRKCRSDARSSFDGLHYCAARIGSKLVRICNPVLPEIDGDDLRLAGSIAGFFDGEGSVSLGRKGDVSGRERVIDIQADGVEDVFALTTTTGNYVVWGLASSNSAGQLQQRPAPREGGMFKRRWFGMVPAVPANIRRVRKWDLAATAEAPGTDPDYTVGTLMARDSAGVFYVEDVIRFRGSPHEVQQAILNTAMLDGKAVTVELSEDPGQAGKAQIMALTRMLAGWTARATRETGSKEVRATPFSAQCEAGNVKIKAASWNDAFFDEIETFPNGAHDDQVDSASGAFAALLTGSNAQDWINYYEGAAKASEQKDATGNG